MHRIMRPLTLPRVFFIALIVALALGLTGPQRRGLAATVNNVSMMVPRSIGPALAGLLLARGWLVAPFVAAAACQFAYLLAYRAFFGDLPGAG